MGHRLVIAVMVLWSLAFCGLWLIRIVEKPEPTNSAWIEIQPDFAQRLTIEDRLAVLEQQWAEHDKTYHFTCEYEDCLTVDELLQLRLGYDGRNR